MGKFLLRLTTIVLFLLVPVLGTWTFFKAPDWGWWFPQNVSSFGGDIDHLFYVLSVPILITFLGTEFVLVWCILRFSSDKPGKADFVHGNHRLELIWTAIPSVVLVALVFGQMGAWTHIKIDMPRDGEFSPEHPIAEVYASQFDWRFRYPDESGNFRGIDAFESAFDFYVPVDTKVVFQLRSRDVLHSFFVPEFRLKQDAVPGMTIPVWFEATKAGTYDLICAELCGWGHYKMAGRVHVLPRADYDDWVAQQRVALYSNGSDD